MLAKVRSAVVGKGGSQSSNDCYEAGEAATEQLSSTADDSTNSAFHSLNAMASAPQKVGMVVDMSDANWLPGLIPSQFFQFLVP